MSDPTRQLICRQKVFCFRSVASMEISEISSIVKNLNEKLQIQLKNDFKLNKSQKIRKELLCLKTDCRKIDIVF